MRQAQAPQRVISIVASVAMGFFLALLTASVGCAPRPERPHIVLITADALRADHLSLDGYPRQTSPRLDAFAREATYFDQAISVIPKTGPSFATLFTGQPPDRHGVRHNQASVPDDLPMLAERFASLGYRTAAFISNPVLRASKGYGRGFDLYREQSAGRGVEQVNRAYLEWSKDGWDEPTFVWIHYIDPHGPYEPPADLDAIFLDDPYAQSDVRVPFDQRLGAISGRNKILGAIPKYQQRGTEDRLSAYIARYDAEIRHVDRAFGEILDDLRSRGLYTDTAIIFTSDHGESLGEHDFYFEHGWFAFDASLRVPLLIKWPGPGEGVTRSTAVSQLDLLPTLLAIAGENSSPVDGVGIDLRKEVEARPPIPVESAYDYPERFVGLRTPEFKYLIRERDGREELYDLGTDPGETDDLLRSSQTRSSDASPRVRDALQSFRDHAETLRESGGFSSPSSSPPESIDDASRRALESLGYLDPAVDSEPEATE